MNDDDDDRKKRDAAAAAEYLRSQQAKAAEYRARLEAWNRKQAAKERLKDPSKLTPDEYRIARKEAGLLSEEEIVRRKQESSRKWRERNPNYVAPSNVDRSARDKAYYEKNKAEIRAKRQLQRKAQRKEP